MTLIAAALFYSFIALLVAFYTGLTIGAKRSSSRLNLNYLELSGKSETDVPHEIVATGYSDGASWTGFMLRYLVVLLAICGIGISWSIWHPTISGFGNEVAQTLLQTLAGVPVNDHGLPFPLLIMLGLLPVWLMCRATLRNSISYPVIVFHILLAAACCVADLWGLNSRLNPAEYLVSTLKWIVFLILFSQAIWAVSYPDPIRSVPFVCLTLIASILVSLSVFVFANLFTAFNSPTLTAFLVYGAFGYVVFGSHLWMLSIVSQKIE